MLKQPLTEIRTCVDSDLSVETSGNSYTVRFFCMLILDKALEQTHTDIFRIYIHISYIC